MTPSQAQQLRELSMLFKEGKASPTDIKELSELLALINGHSEHMNHHENHHDTEMTDLIM
ncbi:MAG: hypothetical protein JKX78_05905 [Alteromonadaceae bacterium]|nr:hypothetical protein [Alteromonadaceae bacterium]